MPQCLFPYLSESPMGSWIAKAITAMANGSLCLALVFLRREGGL